jgi:hypothetical protein
MCLYMKASEQTHKTIQRQAIDNEAVTEEFEF